MPLEFRLLGSLEVERDGRLVPLGGAKERALLALLLLHANEPVSRDLLIDGLWTRPPDGAVHALEARVSALRKRLREPVLHTRPGGYLVEVEAGRLDLLRFETLLGEGRAALADGDAQHADELLSEALAVWRGPPLADVAFEPVALAEAGRLEEERLSALEVLAEARLALGRHDELVAELNALVADHPLRERFQRQLMLALYRSGRQAEALEVYRRGRQLLVEELGIEPGRDLRELQEAILRHDTQLELPATEDEQTPPPPPREELERTVAPHQRKIVTVLFCDISNSTALGESLDPEAMRALLDRYFARMREIVERHEGTVEKFIGDAVMAVFGLPVLHEDDALRACRAACEMRDALPALEVCARIGLATGQVLTGPEDALATGPVVNLAARLEQAASPGEILASAATLQLARDAVNAEPCEPLELRGIAEPVSVYRIITAAAGARPRPPGAPMVGRGAELRRLEDAFAQAVRDRSCQLFTLLGAAGIGKSRLASEFVATVDARVVSGRCLSYGEGISYWPVIEILDQLPARPSDDSAAVAIAGLRGESRRASTPEEIAWAFRTTLEAAASSKPIVCVFDDLHWGESVLLDLVEHVADLSRGVAILLLCLARPELYDRRAAWGGGKLNATTLLLEPLSPEESGELLDRLGAQDSVLRETIIARAEGNPLFLEEMLALTRDQTGEQVAVPASIQALLAARLDQLQPAERIVLERGAVEGKHFHEQALEALTPEESDVQARLESLVRRELIRPAPAAISGSAFVFRHQLIRDAAYNALPKAARAELHERFARWLTAQGAGLAELDELLGYHLEQACAFCRELRLPVDANLAAEGQRRLTTAGRAALLRADYSAAANLLERAAALLPPDVVDAELEADLGLAFFLGRRATDADARAASAAERARAAGDRRAELALRLAREIALPLFDSKWTPDQLQPLIDDAQPVFEHEGDNFGLHLVWNAHHVLAEYAAKFDDSASAAERSAAYAKRAGLPHRQAWMLQAAGGAHYNGATPASEVLAWLDRNHIDTDFRQARARALALLDRADEARERLKQLRAIATGNLGAATSFGGAAELELILGNPQAAATLGVDAIPHYDDAPGYQSNMLTILADAQYDLGQLDDAQHSARRARKITQKGDVACQARAQSIEAKVLARRGRLADAKRLARQAVALAETSQGLRLQADSYRDLGEILTIAGDSETAATSLGEALHRYEQKEYLRGAERIRRALSDLRQRELNPTNRS